MEDWERLGYDSRGEYVKDRFFDEQEQDYEKPVCGTCEYFTQHPQHQDVAWCRRWEEWVEFDDEVCEG